METFHAEKNPGHGRGVFQSQHHGGAMMAPLISANFSGAGGFPGSYAAVEAFLLTPLRSAIVLSFVFAAFSSFRFVVRKRTISS